MASVPSQVNELTPTVPTLTQSGATAAAGQEVGERRIFIHHIDWATYRKVADALTGLDVRVSFDGESMELMTTHSPHAWYARVIFQMVVVLTEETGTLQLSSGEFTMEREDLKKAIEADESFYLVNEPKVRAKERIDLNVDPPPDLGVEIDLTTDSRRRFGIYAKIGVPEIWRYDGRAATIQQRQQDGRYIAVEHSRYFAFLTAADLTRFLAQRGQLDQNALVRSFREWVKNQLGQIR
jgi:Uma2 family endonuclease